MGRKFSLLLAFTQLVFISASPAKLKDDALKTEQDSTLVKRWSPIETHVGHLILKLQQKVLEDHLKNQNGGKTPRSMEDLSKEEAELLEALTMKATSFGSNSNPWKKRDLGGSKEDLLYPINIGPVQDMSRLILNAVREVQEQQLRDGYIGRPNPVRMIG